MEITWKRIGPEGGHNAGRALLQAMYESRFSAPMPLILVTDRGKPYFEGNPVYFSISHTKKHAFCVLSHCPVGLDAEEMDRPIRPELAEKILSAPEKQRFLAAEDSRAALLRLWVLKEAAAKSTGEGLHGYPNDTDFSPEDPRISLIDGCYVAVVEDSENR